MAIELMGEVFACRSIVTGERCDKYLLRTMMIRLSVAKLFGRRVDRFRLLIGRGDK